MVFESGLGRVLEKAGIGDGYWRITIKLIVLAAVDRPRLRISIVREVLKAFPYFGAISSLVGLTLLRLQ